jgi:CRISPR/Cas system-associated exonuclease Cas4 (RecB family)
VTITEQIHASVRQAAEELPLSLDDLVTMTCTERAFLQAHKARTNSPVSAAPLLRKEVEYELGSLTAFYMKEVYGPRFTFGFDQVKANKLWTHVLGFLDNAVMEFGLTEHDVREPPELFYRAALKAGMLGLSDAWVLEMDANSQQWFSYSISGNFEQLYQRFFPFMEHVLGHPFLDQDRPRTASTSTCSACPYSESCGGWRHGNGPDLDRFPGFKDIQIRPDPRLTHDLEGFLAGIKGWMSQDVRISPSEITGKAGRSCDRAVVYRLQNLEVKPVIEPKLRRIFDMGTAIHDAVQIHLSKADPDFTPEVRMRIQDLMISGSCDGVWRETRTGLEIKSISGNGAAKLTGPKPEHKEQATLYAIGLDLRTVIYLYVDKSNFSIIELPTQRDEGTWHKVQDRVKRIIETWKKDELPPKIDKDYVCRECGYAWACKPHLVPSVSLRSLVRRPA